MATTKTIENASLAELTGKGLRISMGYTDLSSAVAVDVATGLAQVESVLVSFKSCAALMVSGGTGGKLIAAPMDHATVANRGKVTIQAVLFSGASVAQWTAFGKGI